MDLDSLLKIFFDNLTLIGVFFITAGLVKVYLYYKFFNIYIFEFIDIKEILILFVNNLFAYFIILFFLSVTLIFLSYVSGLYRVTLPLAVLGMSIVYKLYRKNVYWYETVLQNIVYLVLFLALLIWNKPITNTLTHPEGHERYMLLIIFGTLLLNSIGYARLEYYKVKHKNYYSRIRLILKTGEFQSDENKFYIGKTEKYFFIYDKTTNTAEIFTAEAVTKIFISA